MELRNYQCNVLSNFSENQLLAKNDNLPILHAKQDISLSRASELSEILVILRSCALHRVNA